MPISKEEKNRRFKIGQAAARKSVAERGVISVSLPPEVILAIYDMCETTNKPFHELVRGWIISGVENDNKNSNNNSAGGSQDA